MKFMENFIKLMLAFGIGLLLVLLAMPKVIPFLHKMKFGQVEREEGLESHKKKGGTPTMGGVVFVLAAVIAAFVVGYVYEDVCHHCSSKKYCFYSQEGMSRLGKLKKI